MRPECATGPGPARTRPELIHCDALVDCSIRHAAVHLAIAMPLDVIANDHAATARNHRTRLPRHAPRVATEAFSLIPAVARRVPSRTDGASRCRAETRHRTRRATAAVRNDTWLAIPCCGKAWRCARACLLLPHADADYDAVRDWSACHAMTGAERSGGQRRGDRSGCVRARCSSTSASAA